jgi:ferritin-like metal-binding protein YciE
MEPGRQMPGGENPAVEETRHGDLGGDWRVERLGGLLPPMVGVWKRIRGERGETHLGPLLRYPFRVERRGGRPALVYRPPFSALVDELSGEDGDLWLGRATLGGRTLGRFRMTRIGYHDRTPPQEEVMTREKGLQRKLVEYVEYVHALEQNVLLQLDSLIVNTGDQELVSIFRRHKEETRRQQQRLRERLRALGGPRPASFGKDLAAIATAQVKGVGDVLRPDKAVQNARDAYATEHVEIAAYELLERLAGRAGDEETAAVARENRAEEQAMAGRIAANWDRFLDLTLAEQGFRA